VVVGRGMFAFRVGRDGGLGVGRLLAIRVKTSRQRGRA